MFDGHKRLVSFSAAPELEYKTVRECMDNLEALSTQGTLARMIKHEKRTKSRGVKIK